MQANTGPERAETLLCICTCTSALQRTSNYGKGSTGAPRSKYPGYTLQLAHAFKLQRAHGALITSIGDSTPAAKAGLPRGDVIVAYESEEIEQAADLPRLIANTKPRTSARLNIWREGESHAFKVTTDSFPMQIPKQSDTGTASFKEKRLGVTVHPLTRKDRKSLGVAFALMLEHLDANAQSFQLEPGDVIVAVGNSQFSSIERFETLIAQQAPGHIVALLVHRGNASRFLALRLRR
ncbi:MAG: PDZ domain-containing protein [Burkholderiales bacterium]